MSYRPLIFSAFANTQRPGTPLLKALDEEEKGIEALLGGSKSPFDHKRVTNANVQAIWEQILRYKNRMVAFHYGGHADEKELILLNQQGQASSIPAKSLAGLLGTCPYLQLVFLNGCSTHKQVETLLEYPQIQYVIATQRDIEDHLATKFALQFYQSLNNGDNPQGDMRSAFEHARSYIHAHASHIGIELYTRNWNLTPTTLTRERWALFSQQNIHENPYLIRSLIPFELHKASTEQYKIHKPKFKLDPLLLPRVKSVNPDAPETSLRIRQDQLPELLQRKDPGNPQLNFILTGDGGTGKATALKNIWKNNLGNPQLLPIFINLREINQYSEKDSAPRDWLCQYILKEYLKDEVSKGELIQWIESPSHPSHNKVLLLLNGLDEVDSLHLNKLLKELLRFWFPSDRIICLIGSRKNHSLLEQLNPKSLRILSLTHLWMDQIIPFLDQFDLVYPKEKSDRWALLRNPMMLSHYAQVFTKPAQGDQEAFHKEADLFRLPETQEQLLWNFFELQIYNTIHYPDNPFEFNLSVEKAFIRWLFHFVIAHCAYLTLWRKALPVVDIRRVIEWEKKRLLKQIESRKEQQLPSPLKKIEPFLAYVAEHPDFLEKKMQTNQLLMLIPRRLPFVAESIEKYSYEFDSRLYGRFFAAIHLINCLELHLPSDPLPRELYLDKVSKDVVDMMQSLAIKFPCEIFPYGRINEPMQPSNTLIGYLETLQHNLEYLMLVPSGSKKRIPKLPPVDPNPLSTKGSKNQGTSEMSKPRSTAQGLAG